MKPNQEPIVIANPEDIAKDLGVSRRTINRHLKLLIERGYIKQLVNRQFMYLVNPEMIFKGVLKQYFNKKLSEKNRDREEKKTTKTAVVYITADIVEEEEKT
jgi:predicted transcriptional regulator